MSSTSGEDIEEDTLQDNFGFGFTLGNYTQTLRWNHVYNPKLFSNLSLIFTRFQYDIEGELFDNKILIRSDVIDYGIKQDFNYYKNDNLKRNSLFSI